MKFTKVITVLSLAAVTVAGPASVHVRTGETTCQQNNGIDSCCKDNQKQQSLAKVLPDIIAKDSRLSGVLSLVAVVLPFIAPIISPNVGVSLQCSAIGVISVSPAITTCKSPNACCFNPKTATSDVNTGGLINALNNNNINLCPQILVA